MRDMLPKPTDHLTVHEKETVVGDHEIYGGLDIPACYKSVDRDALQQHLAGESECTVRTHRALLLPPQDHACVVIRETGELDTADIKLRIVQAALYAEKLWMQHVIATTLKRFRSGYDGNIIRVGIPAPHEWYLFDQVHPSFAQYLTSLRRRVSKIAALQRGMIHYGEQLLEESIQLHDQGIRFVGVHNHAMTIDVRVDGVLSPNLLKVTGREIIAPIDGKTHATVNGEQLDVRDSILHEKKLLSSALAINGLKLDDFVLGADIAIEREGQIEGSFRTEAGVVKPKWFLETEKGALETAVTKLSGKRSEELQTHTGRLAPSGDHLSIVGLGNSTGEGSEPLPDQISNAAMLADEAWLHDLLVELLRCLQRGATDPFFAGAMDMGASHGFLLEDSTFSEKMQRVTVTRNGRIHAVMEQIIESSRKVSELRQVLASRGVVSVSRRNLEKLTELMPLGVQAPINARQVHIMPMDEDRAARADKALLILEHIVNSVS